MLPTASAAYGEMLAPRLNPDVRRHDKTLDMPLGIRLLLAVELHVGHVARCAKRDKHHHVIDAGQGIALGRHVGYLDPLEQG